MMVVVARVLAAFLVVRRLFEVVVASWRGILRIFALTSAEKVI